LTLLLNIPKKDLKQQKEELNKPTVDIFKTKTQMLPEGYYTKMLNK
jgi:hypothetical protein